jgi:lipopolysaccharide export system protein LptA
MKMIPAMLLFLLLSSIFTYSEEDNPGKRTPIVLEWADTLAGMGVEGQRIRDWKGNVRFRQGDVLVESDLARQYLDANKLDLIGNVKITQDSLLMTAPKVFYNGNSKVADAIENVKIINGNTTLTANTGKYYTETKIAVFTGDVFIDDDSTTISAEKIIYHRSDENSFAYGNVEIRGKFSNTILNADTILHYPEKYFTQALGKPILTQIDTVKKKSDPLITDTLAETFEFDTLLVSSAIMEAFRSEHVETYTFLDSVNIIRGSVSAKSEEAFYDKFEEIIYLYDVPVVWFDSTQLHADSIMIYIPDKKLSRIHAHTNSLAATRDDTLRSDMISQITGDDIIIEFKQDSVDFIHSYGNAKSLFFDKNEEGEYNAARVSSDTIQIIFEYGDPSKLYGLSGANSEFFPENILLNRTKDLYLPGFRWSDLKPKRLEIRK